MFKDSIRILQGLIEFIDCLITRKKMSLPSNVCMYVCMYV